MFFRIFITLVLLFQTISYGREYILFISLDGFRYDYANKVETPNLDYIESIGVKASSLIPVFPSLTFPNHFSMATGCYPDKHGIIGNTFFSKRIDKLYKISDRSSVENKKFYLSEPIWNTIQRYGKKSATFFWVGSEAPIGGTYPNYYKRYDKSVSYQSRVDTMEYWFNLPEDKRPDLVMLYFDEPDHTGHLYGANGKNIDKSISKIDNTLGDILDRIKGLSIYDSLNIIIASDHGMANVTKERVIIIDDYINITDNFDIVSEGPYMQINFIDNSNIDKVKIHKQLGSVPNIIYYFRDDIPRNLNILNSDTPDLIIIPDIGWIVSSNKENLYERFIDEMRRGATKGMHGYTTDNIEMHGIFYAAGPAFSHGKISSLENIDIYPALCKILDIPITHEIDGDISKLTEVLK